MAQSYLESYKSIICYSHSLLFCQCHSVSGQSGPPALHVFLPPLFFTLTLPWMMIKLSVKVLECLKQLWCQCRSVSEHVQMLTLDYLSVRGGVSAPNPCRRRESAPSLISAKVITHSTILLKHFECQLRNSPVSFRPTHLR